MFGSDADIIRQDLLSPESPYYLNKPTVMDIVNGYPYNNLGQTQSLPNVQSPQQTSKSKYFGNNTPNILRIPNVDCFTAMQNSQKKVMKKNTIQTLLAAGIVGSVVGLLLGRAIKLPKINFTPITNKFSQLKTNTLKFFKK